MSVFKSVLFGFAVCFLVMKTYATTISDTLHINKGTLTNFDYNRIQILNFNATDTFDLTPYVIKVNTGDVLSLTILNHDVIDHDIVIEGVVVDIELSIAAGKSGKALINLTKPAMLKVSDNTEKYRYLGLNTFVVVENKGIGNKSYFWNLREFSVLLMKYFDTEYPSALNNYTADYFTINNRSYPHVLNDPNVYIQSKLGDTVTVYIYNSGLMNHNLHFHGYHAKIRYSSDRPNYVGRLKDSMPIDKGQFLVLEIVPQQVGTFPIHNHNLGATVGTNRFNGGFGIAICGSDDTAPADNLYPFGMLTEIVISP
jgi:hypothetical protein